MGLAALLLVGCTAGSRAQGVFEAEFDLRGVDSLTVDLPSTPVSMRGCDPTVPESCPRAVQLEGRWHAVGATAREARAHAARPALTLDIEDSLGYLSADVPTEVLGLVDLELDTAVVPEDIDLEVRTRLGDVTLRDLAGSVLVDVEVGNVDVRGMATAVGIRVEDGDVSVDGPGVLEVHARHGGVRVQQTAGAAATTIRAPGGDVVLMLGDDGDVDLRISTRGRIRVQTDAFATSTSGLYRARSGDGATAVDIEAGGDVTVRLQP